MCQLIIIFIFFQSIKSDIKELTNKLSIIVYGNNYFYINLTKLANQVGNVYLDIMLELPKGWILAKKFLFLYFLESNEISFSDTSKFKQIDHSSYYSKTIHGTYIYTQDWFKFKIQLKMDTKYLLFITPLIEDDQNNKINPTYTIQLTGYEEKVENDNNNNDNEKSNSSTFSIIRTIITVFAVIVIIIILVYIYYKKKRSEINIPLYIDESPTLSNNFSSKDNKAQSLDCGVQKSNIE